MYASANRAAASARVFYVEQDNDFDVSAERHRNRREQSSARKARREALEDLRWN